MNESWFFTFFFCLPAVFSAVTLLLLPHSQGNIWLFEDSVLITRKLPGKFTRFFEVGANQSFDLELNTSFTLHYEVDDNILRLKNF